MAYKKDVEVLQLVQAVLKAQAPKDTWNLTNNGIRLVQNGMGYEIRIGGEVAPYAKILNKQGKHKGWVKRAVDSCKESIKKIVIGGLSEEEIEELKDQPNKMLEDKRAEFIARKEREHASII